jgi:hypothetical protein
MGAPTTIRKVVSVKDLKHGDTVEVNEVLETVSRSHLKRGFCGYTYKGEPHVCGIIKVTFAVPTANGVRHE